MLHAHARRRPESLSRRLAAMPPQEAAIAFEEAPYAKNFSRQWLPRLAGTDSVVCGRRKPIEYSTAGSFGTTVQEFVPSDPRLPSLTIYTVQEAIEAGKQIGLAPGLVAVVKNKHKHCEVAVAAVCVTETAARTFLAEIAGCDRHQIVFKIGALALVG